MTKQEYLDFISKLLDQQYGSDDEELDTTEEADHWIPAESPLKDKIPFSALNGTTDLTNVKGEKLKQILHTGYSFKVDHFLIKAKRTVNPLGGTPRIEIELWEERFRTPSGNPCRITYRVDVGKDSRFQQCPWANKFLFHSARQGSEELLYEIVRWMQALKRMTAFL